ncbi:MAG TPA: efflux RND transporter periplasmic adaptor subunit, partial [Saprospiraceae bacterium]|nr:efflux RND transporter periplasmic adaptor subunit [Saprospiraceae bacterium]
EEGEQAVMVHAKIDKLNETLLSGMFVEARINIDENNTNTLPSDAVVSNGNEHYIFAEYEPDVFRQVQVRIGATDQGFTEVFPLDSMAPDSKIVISGAYYLLSELTKGEGEHHE